MRKIVHIDMDAFYASVEQRDNPDLKGKPIGVGGGGRRGVLTTASYEARKFGVRSAMPGFKARQLCPELIFVPPRFDAYKQVSHQIRSIFSEYTDLIEPLSLDEAYLDVTSNKNGEPIATKIAEQIKSQIFETTQLTCSAGISYNKFLAKVASDINKPNGVFIIKPNQAQKFLEHLPIGRFYGIGKVTASKMGAIGIRTGADLKKLSKIELTDRFGKMGAFYYDIVRGVDDREVNPVRERKSLAVERTLLEDLSDLDAISEKLEEIIDTFHARLSKSNTFGRTITLKIKTSDFKIITRSRSIKHKLVDKQEIRRIAHDLLKNNTEAFIKIRLIGLTASNFDEEKEEPTTSQIKLFD